MRMPLNHNDHDDRSGIRASEARQRHVAASNATPDGRGIDANVSLPTRAIVRAMSDAVRSTGRRAPGTAAAVAAAVVFAVAAFPIQSFAAAAECAPPLRVVFSCSTGTKTILVCASSNLTTESGRLQYRFGRPSTVEMSYPPAGADWRAVTRGGTLAFSGGGGAFLAFLNAPYRYIVYSAVGRGWGSKAGVVVEKDGKPIANRACRGKPVSELGPDLFSSAGIQLDNDSFELP